MAIKSIPAGPYMTPGVIEGVNGCVLRWSGYCCKTMQALRLKLCASRVIVLCKNLWYVVLGRTAAQCITLKVWPGCTCSHEARVRVMETLCNHE
jgi:hypothetical protein